LKLIIALFFILVLLLFKSEIGAILSQNEVPLEQSVYDSLPEEGLSFQELQKRREETETETAIERDQARLRQMVSKPIRQQQKPVDDGRFVVEVKENAQAVEGESPGLENQSVDGEINRLMAERQLMDEMTEAKKVAYAQNFLRRARAKGFAVKMDKNFQIISIKKIRSR